MVNGVGVRCVKTGAPSIGGSSVVTVVVRGRVMQRDESTKFDKINQMITWIVEGGPRMTSRIFFFGFLCAQNARDWSVHIPGIYINRYLFHLLYYCSTISIVVSIIWLIIGLDYYLLTSWLLWQAYCRPWCESYIIFITYLFRGLMIGLMYALILCLLIDFFNKPLEWLSGR